MARLSLQKRPERIALKTVNTRCAATTIIHTDTAANKRPAMSKQAELPTDVIAAIQANRKIEAIRLLREAQGIGLREAKEAVEAYIKANPHLESNKRSGFRSPMSPLILFVLIAAMAYMAYHFFV